MQIDVQTLALAAGISNIVEICVLVVLYRLYRIHQGPGWWLTGMALVSLSSFTNLVRADPALGVPATVATFAAVVGGMGLAYVGVLRFVGRRESPARLLGTWAVLTSLVAIAAVAGQGVAGYQVLIGVAMGLLAILFGQALLHPLTRTFRASAILLAGAWALEGAFFAARVPAVLVGAVPASSPFAPAGWLVATNVVAFVATMGIVFGYVLITVQRMAAEVVQSRDRIDRARRDEMVARLAGGVAHNLNNVLMVILGSVDEMDRQLPAGDALRPGLADIKSASLRAAATTAQLLKFGRRSASASGPTEVDSAVRSMEPMLAEFVRADVTLTIMCGVPGATVGADERQLEDALVSLLFNACDAMPAGGRVAITTRSAQLDQGAPLLPPTALPGAFVAIDVVDTGTGIAPDVLPHVFEPFFTTKPLVLGAGLGLSSIEGIAGQAGGFVGVTSEVGVGSTFTIYLPQLPVAQPDARPAGPVDSGRGAPPHAAKPVRPGA